MGDQRSWRCSAYHPEYAFTCALDEDHQPADTHLDPDGGGWWTLRDGQVEVPADRGTQGLQVTEKWLRMIAGDPGRDWIKLVLAEYDRRGVVEKAAVAYAMAGLHGSSQTDQREKLNALLAALRTSGAFRG